MRALMFCSFFNSFCIVMYLFMALVLNKSNWVVDTDAFQAFVMTNSFNIIQYSLHICQSIDLSCHHPAFYCGSISRGLLIIVLGLGAFCVCFIKACKDPTT